MYTGMHRVDTGSGSEVSHFQMSAQDGRLSLEIDFPVNTEVWFGEVGQTKPTAVYGLYFPGVGNLLALQAEEGASMLRLILLRIEESGSSSIVFDEMSRFGFDILDTDGDSVAEIIVSRGDLMGSKSIMVYRWDKSVFVPDQHLQSQQLPSYKLIVTP